MASLKQEGIVEGFVDLALKIGGETAKVIDLGLGHGWVSVALVNPNLAATQRGVKMLQEDRVTCELPVLFRVIDREHAGLQVVDGELGRVGID